MALGQRGRGRPKGSFGSKKRGFSLTDIGAAMVKYEAAYKHACMDEFDPNVGSGDVRVSWWSALKAKDEFVASVTYVTGLLKRLDDSNQKLRETTEKLHSENRLLAEMVLESRETIRELRRAMTGEADDNNNEKETAL